MLSKKMKAFIHENSRNNETPDFGLCQNKNGDKLAGVQFKSCGDVSDQIELIP